MVCELYHTANLLYLFFVLRGQIFNIFISITDRVLLLLVGASQFYHKRIYFKSNCDKPLYQKGLTSLEWNIVSSEHLTYCTQSISFLKFLLTMY